MEKKKRKFIKRLKNKYRLVILNDETLQESTSITLTPLNVFIVFSSSLVVYGFIVVCLLLYSPLKVYLPEKPNPVDQRENRKLERTMDSLIRENMIYRQKQKYQEMILHGTEMQRDSALDALKQTQGKPLK